MLFTRTFAFALLCLAVTVPAAPTDPSVMVARESPLDLQRKLYSSTTNTNKLGSLSVRAPIGTLSANRCNFDLFFTFTFVVARTPFNYLAQFHAGGLSPLTPPKGDLGGSSRGDRGEDRPKPTPTRPKIKARHMPKNAYNVIATKKA